MKDNRKKLGNWGEEEAKNFLLKQGYMLVAKNWRNRFGELDLVMLDQKTIVFVEVRTKNNNRFGMGYESINYRKQQKLKSMAQLFLESNQWLDYSGRFDIISIDRINESYQVTHLKNVF